MDLIVRPHIMSDRESCVRQDVPFGTTVAEAVDMLENIDARVKKLNLAVTIDGVTVPQEFWHERRLTREDGRVEIAAVLHGGGGGAKKILGLVAMIALSIVATPLAGMLMETALGGTLAGMGLTAGMAASGIMMVGSLVISAIFAPPKVKNTASDNSDKSNAYTFGSQANQMRPFAPVMRVYGKHRVKPDLAAVPYTLNVGDDTYFFALYSFGYGPLKLEDFKIGTNALTNYKDYDIVVHENFTSSSQLQIYKQDIWQDSYNAVIARGDYKDKQGSVIGGPVLATSRPAVDEVIVDIVFVQGLGKVTDKGGTEETSTEMRIEVQRKDVPGWNPNTSPWQPANIITSSDGTTGGSSTNSAASGQLRSVPGNINYYRSGENETQYFEYQLPAGSNNVEVVGWGGEVPPVGTTMKVGPYNMVIANRTTDHVVWTENLPGTITTGQSDIVGFDYTPASTPFGGGTGGGAADGVWRFKAARQGGFPASAHIKLPAIGTWVVRITKLDPDHDPDSKDENEKRYIWNRSLVALKSLKSVPPVNPEVNLTLVELKMKATGQLNGSVEEFSAMASSKLRTWDGASWVLQETRNPAWIYLDILTGTANRRKVLDRRVDMEKLKEWAVKCNTITPGFLEPMGTCDIIIDKSYTTWELLQSVATCGRASPTMRDNKYSVLIDDANRMPVQMFTPRNTSGLSSTRSYVEEPHALRVKWIDPFANYEAAEISVYNTGYNEDNATIFEELSTFGMTRVEQVTRYGRYMLAQGKLRQERFSFTTDIESIVCVRGDLVLVAHDVLEVGGEAMRIVAISFGGYKLEVDMPPWQIPGVEPFNLGVRIRRANGIITPAQVITGYDNVAQTIDLQSLVACAPGDMLVIGPIQQVLAEYVVDKVIPNADLGATIHLEEYAPAVYQAELTGIIPNYSVQGGGSSAASAPPQNTAAVILEFIDDSLPHATVYVTWTPPPGAVENPPLGYRVWATMSGGVEVYLGETMGLSYTDANIDLWAQGGSQRLYRVRAFYGGGGISMPGEATANLPVRMPVPPPDVEVFDVVNSADGMRRYVYGWPSLTWPLPWFEGVEVRYVAGTVNAPVWESMTPVLLPYFTQAQTELSAPKGSGAFTFAAKAVDVRGQRSVNAKIVQRTLVLSSQEQAEQGSAGADQTPPPTPTNFTASPGLGSAFVSVDAPNYSMGGGNDHTNIYGVVYTGGTAPSFISARLLGTIPGSSTTAMLALEPGTDYRLWAKYVTKAGVASLNPAGGAAGLAITTGQDVTKLLNILQNKITTSQLYTDLNSRINLVDGYGPGSVNSRLTTQELALNTKITAEANTRYDAVTGLQAQYTVKIDVNGYVAGYGLAVEANNGKITSGFVIRADSFAIAAPGMMWGGPDAYAPLQPKVPFGVVATPFTYNGQYVPQGVYMNEAFIVNGSIQNAMIGDLTVTTAKIGYLQVANHNLAPGAVTDANSGTSMGNEISIWVNVPDGSDALVIQANTGTLSITTASGGGENFSFGTTFYPAWAEIFANGNLLRTFANGTQHDIIAIKYPAPGTYNIVLRRSYTVQYAGACFASPATVLVEVFKK